MCISLYPKVNNQYVLLGVVVVQIFVHLTGSWKAMSFKESINKINYLNPVSDNIARLVYILRIAFNQSKFLGNDIHSLIMFGYMSTSTTSLIQLLTHD